MPHPAAFPAASHLNLIEHLWDAVHRHVTHSRLRAVFSFFTETLPRERKAIPDSVTDISGLSRMTDTGCSDRGRYAFPFRRALPRRANQARKQGEFSSPSRIVFESAMRPLLH